MKEKYFLSVDWGTTNFRLRLVEKSSQLVIERNFAEHGIGELHSQWQHEGGDRENFFLHFLKSRISDLFTEIPDQITIVVSGMASSELGIRPLPYGALPLTNEGKGIFFEIINHEIFPGALLLVSGVCSGSDIMRGEEVQLLGLLDYVKPRGNIIFILPGTHSKHALFDGNKITGFTTFMTGEFFKVIQEHTIIAKSIEKPPPDFTDMKAFENGVYESREGISLLNSVFKVRVQEVIGKMDKSENYHYLSGLLIGEELKALQNLAFDNIYICGEPTIVKYYADAIKIFGLEKKAVIFSGDIIEKAVIRGHLKLIENSLEKI